MAHLASSNWPLCFAERSGCQHSIVKTSSLQYHILHYNVNIANILDMVHQANWLLKSLFTNRPIERRYYVYIYMYVYIYVYICIYIYVYMYIYITILLYTIIYEIHVFQMFTGHVSEPVRVWHLRRQRWQLQPSMAMAIAWNSPN